MTRPGEIVVTSANMDFADGGDAAYLDHLCERADVLLLQELKNVWLAHALPKGWTALQDTTSEATRGSAIAFRDGVIRQKGPLRLRVGTAPMGTRLLTRHIASAVLADTATGHPFKAVSCHLPPARFRWLQPPMTRRLAGVVRRTTLAVIVGTDANQPIGRLGHAVGLHAYGRGIVGILTDTHVLGGTTVDTWGERHDHTDHPAVTCTIRIPKETP